MLQLLPAQTDLLVEIKQPRQVLEALTRADIFKRAMELSAVKEGLAGTKARRVRQLVAYVEKELGLPWPEILDKLAGGGAALGVKFAPDPAPALLVIQGKDEVILQKFLTLALDVIGQELARQESKDSIERGAYQGIPTVQIGSKFFIASAGATLILSNTKDVLTRSLDLHLGKGGKSLADSPALAAAAKLLPSDPMARLWVNLEEVKKRPEAKRLYKMPRDDPNLTILLGGYLDLIGRSPWVTAGLHQGKEDLLLTVRLPSGREGMGPDGAVFVPAAGQAGSRPLLEPKGVLYSDSSFHDLSKIVENRGKLFNAQQNKVFEKADQDTSKFLSGFQLSKLVSQVGAYHRFVAVNQATVPYQTKPKVSLPAFAFVLEMRQPEAFSKSLDTVLRGAALVALTKVKIKLMEEKHAGCDIVAWRFDETARMREDENNLRFNFSPCFATVGNQFVVCSTMELCREIIDLLKKESTASQGAVQTARTRLYAAGIAEVLRGFEDQLYTQTILNQALPPAEAREQVRAVFEMVRRLGTLSLDANIGATDFHYDIRLGGGK